MIIETLKNFFIIVIIIFAIIMSFLYWYEVNDRERYMIEKQNQLKAKEIEIGEREMVVIEKETCMGEIKKLKEKQNSITKILTS